jgi:RecQ-mediated genome instability protein 1
MANFFASISQNQQRAPLSALTQTAVFRILASNFTESLSTSSPTTLLPRDISDPTVQERRIPGPVPVQVIDIEDIGTSLWAQVEKIEQVERGETVRGREIVRNVNVDGGDSENTGNATTASRNTIGNGPHRLVLQDSFGTKAVALELKDIPGIAIDKISIGAKLVLKNTIVGRGMILLTPDTVTLLGGKIEAMDTLWRQTRKERLLARIQTSEGEQQQNSANNGDAMEE